MAAYGHQDLAADVADKTIANAIQQGISEHYDSVSGKPLGIRDYCMSRTLVTMMLDGLTKNTHLNALGRRLNARFGREEHVVVADQEHDQPRFKARHAAVFQSPEHILSLVAADPDVDDVVLAEMLLPARPTAS